MADIPAIALAHCATRIDTFTFFFLSWCFFLGRAPWRGRAGLVGRAPSARCLSPWFCFRGCSWWRGLVLGSSVSRPLPPPGARSVYHRLLTSIVFGCALGAPRHGGLPPCRGRPPRRCALGAPRHGGLPPCRGRPPCRCAQCTSGATRPRTPAYRRQVPPRTPTTTPMCPHFAPSVFLDHGSLRSR